jgi:hypothetical protein
MTELFINDYRVDLSKKEAVALSYAVNRLTDIDSRQGSYSNTFKLPLTNYNRERFGFPANVNATTTQRYNKLDAMVKVNGVVVVNGFAQLKQVGDSIDVVVKWGNSDWIKDIGKLTLRDLDMADLDHVPTSAYIQANRFNGSSANDLVYPDIDYGNQLWLDGIIPAWYFRPSLFFKPLLSRIFNQAGWTISVLEVDGDPLFTSLIVPYIDEQAIHTEEWVTLKAFTTNVEAQSLVAPFPTAKFFSVGFDTAPIDNDSQFTTGAWVSTNEPTRPTPDAFYTPNEQIEQDFVFHLEFEVTDWRTPLAKFQVQFTDAAYGVRFDDALFNSGTFGVFNVNGVEAYRHSDASGVGTFSIDIRTGLMRGCEKQAIQIFMYECDVDIISGYLTTEVSTSRLPYSMRNMAQSAPKIKQTDIVKYLVNTFSLLIIPDNVNRSVAFIKMDSMQTNPSEDWSNKIDLTEKPVHSFDVGGFAQNNRLTYETDSNDSGLVKVPELGWWNIESPELFDVENTLYACPMGLCARRATHSGSKELALIDINQDATPVNDLRFIEITVILIDNTSMVTVLSGANLLSVGSKVAYFGSSAQTFDGDPINRQTFTVSEIASDTVFYVEELILGTPYTSSGTIYAGAWDRWITVPNVDWYEDGDEVVLYGVAGTVTVNGEDVNGRLLRVVNTIGNCIEIDEVIKSSTYPDTSAAKIVATKEWNEPSGTVPRLGYHIVSSGGDWPISLIGEATETNGSEVRNYPLYWETIVADHWTCMSGIIIRPHMVQPLLRLSSVDINQLDFTRPKWIEYFQSFFFLSFVNQYRADIIASTDVELIRIDQI